MAKITKIVYGRKITLKLDKNSAGQGYTLKSKKKAVKLFRELAKTEDNFTQAEFCEQLEITSVSLRTWYKDIRGCTSSSELRSIKANKTFNEGPTAEMIQKSAKSKIANNKRFNKIAKRLVRGIPIEFSMTKGARPQRRFYNITRIAIASVMVKFPKVPTSAFSNATSIHKADLGAWRTSMTEGRTTNESTSSYRKTMPKG